MADLVEEKQRKSGGLVCREIVLPQSRRLVCVYPGCLTVLVRDENDRDYVCATFEKEDIVALAKVCRDVGLIE